nr:alpha-tubulin N-acetyltransferase isoform X2 [Nomia melanderi]
MEFKFNVNKLLPRKINKVTHTLVPEDFKGDRRELQECQRQLSRILDDMGEASARAQGLNKPITSALKLRDTDHIVYLLIDNEANSGLGSVVGLLKTGSKNLFMFDETGAHYQLKPRCILDFYVHETRQRMGLGNILYQHMLSVGNLESVERKQSVITSRVKTERRPVISIYTTFMGILRKPKLLPYFCPTRCEYFSFRKSSYRWQTKL